MKGKCSIFRKISFCISTPKHTETHHFHTISFPKIFCREYSLTQNWREINETQWVLIFSKMILNYKEKAFAYLFIYFQGIFSFVFQNKKKLREKCFIFRKYPFLKIIQQRICSLTSSTIVEKWMSSCDTWQVPIDSRWHSNHHNTGNGRVHLIQLEDQSNPSCQNLIRKT